MTFDCDRSGRQSQNGASLVEFAILAPLLILLLFGIIELGWLFAQNVEIRHAAREAAREAATNPGDQAAILAAACSSLQMAADIIDTVALDMPAAEIGARATVTLTASPESFTSLFSWIMPPTLESTVEIRIEQTVPGASGWTGSC